MQTRAERQQELERSEAQERRSMVRGLVLLALVILVLSVLRAGLHRVFPQGWWRL